MKTLVTSFFLLCLAFSANAQMAVKFWGTNSAGLPPFWPRVVQPGAVTPPGFVQMNQAQLAQIISTNQSAYNAWLTQKQQEVKAATDANIERLLTLYSAIPEARQQFAAGRALMATVEGSLASGTNNTAQIVNRVRQMAQVEDEIIRYLDGIAEILQRLGPVLKTMYKPEEDETQ